MYGTIFKYFIHTNTKYHTPSPVFLDASKLSGEVGFSSLYAVDSNSATAIEQEGTTSAFKGVVWSERLWLDFDSEESAQRALSSLKEMEYDYVVYHTGNRGIHVGILRNCAPSHRLPARDKEWVGRHFPEADASIYTHLHLFRLPATKHESTGGRKILLQHVLGGSLLLPPLQEKDVTYDRCATGAMDTSRSVFANYRVMGETIRVPIGQRHATLTKVAYALRDAGKAPTFAYEWLLELNKWFSEPKDEQQINQIVQSVYR